MLRLFSAHRARPDVNVTPKAVPPATGVDARYVVELLEAHALLQERARLRAEVGALTYQLQEFEHWATFSRCYQAQSTDVADLNSQFAEIFAQLGYQRVWFEIFGRGLARDYWKRLREAKSRLRLLSRRLAVVFRFRNTPSLRHSFAVIQSAWYPVHGAHPPRPAGNSCLNSGLSGGALLGLV